jgi:hypothetical protein
MVKTKLKQKQIDFNEKEFSEIADIIHSDHAPALYVSQDKILNSPTEIVNWINNYGV